MRISDYLAQIGRAGGKSTSAAKRASSRRNLKLAQKARKLQQKAA